MIVFTSGSNDFAAVQHTYCDMRLSVTETRVNLRGIVGAIRGGIGVERARSARGRAGATHALGTWLPRYGQALGGAAIGIGPAAWIAQRIPARLSPDGSAAGAPAVDEASVRKSVESELRAEYEKKLADAKAEANKAKDEASKAKAEAEKAKSAKPAAARAAKPATIYRRNKAPKGALEAAARDSDDSDEEEEVVEDDEDVREIVQKDGLVIRREQPAQKARDLEIKKPTLVTRPIGVLSLSTGILDAKLQQKTMFQHLLKLQNRNTRRIQKRKSRLKKRKNHPRFSTSPSLSQSASLYSFNLARTSFVV